MAGFHLPVGTVTLLLADIEGSTRRWQDEPEAMAVAVAAYDELITDSVGRHGGVRPIEQGEGDSFVAAFSRASDGLACTLELQRALAVGELHVRMGLHTGEVQLRNEGNYIGTAINRCGRIRSLAHGGQTLLSRTTHDLVADRLPDGVTLVDLGPQRLRDLARPEHVFELGHPELAAGFPPLHSLDAVPNNLPAQLTSFIGREDELVQLEALLPDARLLTLVGAGGCGKTRLGLQLAANVIDEYPDGTWFVDLAPVSDPDALEIALAGAIGVTAETSEPVLDVLLRQIGDRQVLLLLDNCEHLIDRCAALVTALLYACPRLAILATSREPLGVGGEVQWRVPSLAMPNEDEPGPIETLARYDAVRLFIERAVRARPNFSVNNDNAPAVAAICCRLDGIPLAIELAAARVRMLPPEQIAAGLDDRFRLLSGGARTVIARQQTLRASVDWSHELLGESERAVFRRLTVFAGGFDLDAAEAVGASAPVDEYAVFEVLSSLVDKSLVLADEHGTTARYRMLETVRQYAAERLEESGERAAVGDRHLTHYRRTVTGKARNRVQIVTHAEVERHNLRTALAWAQATGQGDAALRLCQGLYNHFLDHGDHREGARAFRTALEAAADAPSAARAIALASLSQFVVSLEGRDAALVVAEEALRLARESEIPILIALATASVASTSPLSKALALADDAKAQFEALDDQWWLSSAFLYRGVVFANCGMMADADPSFEEAERTAGLSGHTIMLMRAKVWRGVVPMLLGQHALAVTRLDHALDEIRTARIPRIHAEGLRYRSELLLRMGDHLGALAACNDALALPEIHLEMWAPIQAARGRATLACGDAAAARELIDDALRRLRSAGWFDIFPTMCRSAAEACLVAGDAAAAREWCALLSADADEVGDRWRANQIQHALGLIEQADGDVGVAEDHFRTALGLATACGDPAEVADALEAIGGCAAAQESYVEGARLLAAGVRAREAIGYARFPTDQPRFEAVVDAVRTALGDDAFDAAWAEGTAMSTEEAVAYVERGRGERKRPSVGWGSLTPTEFNVVELIAEGLTNPQICERLLMSRSTVKTHLTHVFEKLGVATRSELAARHTARA